MTVTRENAAAQYLRMSSEVQDLSVAIQESTIRAYCAENGLTLAATYKDEAKSGLSLRGRAGLRQLLRDVSADDCAFSIVLVYDVSRWGRFQDADESAYWDFHCSLHGVRVVYVNEPFPEAPSALTALMKSLKRTMAAEYSRELGIKARAGQDRAIDLGFHMGTLPAAGLRRMAVSKEPGRHRLLQAGERKGSQEDRIKWVPGPDSEVALVRRIFHLYAHTSLHMTGIMQLLNDQGFRDRNGVPFTEPMIRGILDCEAFIGNFVWSKHLSGTQHRRPETDPLFRRTFGTIEPIIDRETWDRVQAKRYWRKGVFRTKPQLLGGLKAALLERPDVTVTELPSLGCGTKASFEKVFGSVDEAFRLAGRDFQAARSRKVQRQVRGWRVTRSLVHDLEDLFTAHDIDWVRPKRQHLFVFNNGVRLRLQLMWRLSHQGEEHWWLSKHLWSGPIDYVLAARMNQDETAQDFLLLSRSVYRSAPPWSWVHLPAGVTQVRDVAELLAQVRALTDARPDTVISV